MSGVEIRVRSDSTQARNDLAKLEKAVSNIETRAASVSKAFNTIAITLTAALTGSGVTRSFVKAADSITSLETRVKLVVGEGKELKATMTELYAVAARARAPINSTATVFNRFGLSLKNSGKSTNEFLRVTENIQKAVAISGGSAESANAAIIQLGQGLASGTLRGEEYNSVAEQAPRIAQAIADGIGIPFEKLRDAAKDGLLTTEAVFAAILAATGKLEKEFKLVGVKTEDLLNIFNNELTRALSALDKQLGFSKNLQALIIAFTKAFKFIADNLDVFVLYSKNKLAIFSFDVRSLAEQIRRYLSNIFTLDNITSKANQIAAEIEKITDAVIALTSGIDTDSIVSSISTTFTTLKDSLASIVFQGPNINYTQISADISQTFNTLKDEITSSFSGNSLFTDGIDLSKITGDITSAFNTLKTSLDTIVFKGPDIDYNKIAGDIKGTYQVLKDELLRFFTENEKTMVPGKGQVLELPDTSLIDKFRESFKVILPEFDYETLLENIKGKAASFTEDMKTLLPPINLDVIKLNLSDYIPDLTKTLEFFQIFAQGVYGWFEWIVKKVLKNSPWPELLAGIEKPTLENGLLDSVLARFKSFGGGILETFNTLKTDAINAWTAFNNSFKGTSPDQNLVTRFYIDISSDAKSILSNLTRLFDTKKLVDTPVGPREVDANALEDLATNIGSAFDNITAKLEEITPTWSKFKDVIDSGAASLEEYSAAFKNFAMTKTIKTVVDTPAGPKETEVKVPNMIAELLTGINENKALIGTAIGGALLAGFIATSSNPNLVPALLLIGASIFQGFISNFGKQALIIGGVAFAPEILNSPEFQKSLNSIGKSIGSGLNNLFNGEGDYFAEAGQGLADSLQSLGSGLVEGFFGPEFNTEFNDKLGGAIAAALAVFVLSSAVRGLLGKIGLKIAKAIFASTWAAEFVTGLTLGLTNAISTAKANRAIIIAAGNLGIFLGQLIRRSIVATAVLGIGLLISQELEKIYVEDGVKTNLEAAILGAFEGAAVGGAIGSLFGPAGAIGGAIVSALIGSVVSVWNNSQIGQEVNKWISNTATELYIALRDKLKSVFSFFEKDPIQVSAEVTIISRKSEVDLAGDTASQSLRPLPFTKKASGGYISGKGGPKDDLIPAMLSNGEFVLNAAAVDKFGVGFLSMLNSGQISNFGEGSGAPKRNVFIPPDIQEFGPQINSRLFQTLVKLADSINNGMSNVDNSSLIKQYDDTIRYLSDEISAARADLDKPLGGDSSAAGVENKSRKATELDKYSISQADAVRNSFQQALSKSFRAGSFKGFLSSILDSFTSQIIDTFAKGITDKIFNGLIGSVNKDGVYDEGLLDGLFTKVFGFGEKAAGVVTEGITEGVDSAKGEGAGGFESLFASIKGGITGLFSGIFGEGGLFSSLFSGLGSIFGIGGGATAAVTGMAVGGIVTGGIRGVDSVPTMLTPGELVVPEKNIDDFMNGVNNNNKTQQVINLNITGDISRQTKSEIIKMLPTIATGVSAVNKERGLRA